MATREHHTLSTMSRLRPTVVQLVFTTALLCLLGFCLSPIVWQVVTALKPAAELTVLPPIFPRSVTVAHIAAVFAERPFVRVLVNSAVVAAGTSLFCLVIGTPAAFALAKLPVPGRQPLLLSILAVSMFPPIAVVGSLFLLLRFFQLRDTYWALILADTTFALPLTVWVLTSFLRDIPDDLLRAARVDGCSAWQALWYVFVPVAAPGLVTAALLTFVFTWNEFLFALTFTTTTASRTVPVEISLFSGVHEVPWGEIAAASVIVTLPVLVVVLVMQRYLIAGLTAGAVKG